MQRTVLSRLQHATNACVTDRPFAAIVSQVTLSVVSGTLTYPGDPAVATITFTDNLDNITRLFGEIIYTRMQQGVGGRQGW